MRDVERQLRDYCAEIAANLPVPSLETALRERLGAGDVRPLQQRLPARRRPVWATAVVAFATVVAFGAVIWLLGIGERSVPTTDGGRAVTEAPPATELPPDVAGLLHAEWTLEASYDGWLRPVAFDGGFAAVRRLEPRREMFVETADVFTDWRADVLATGEASVGEIWLSPDGVEWAPAPAQPPEVPWSLSSDGETLFVETGNVYSGTGVIWASDTGDAWRAVLTGEEYGRLFSVSRGSGDMWAFVEGTVAAGPPGAVVFGVDHDGRLAGWVYDGERFVPADVAAVSSLPPESEFRVAALGDRFLLYTYDVGAYTSETTMKVSFSATGEVWGALEPKPPGGPLVRPEADVQGVTSAHGLNLITMSSGYGLWVTRDGSSWDEISLRPADNGWMPEVAGGGFGWLVYSPPRRETVFSSVGQLRNRGLWYSPDAGSWTELDDLGPLGDPRSLDDLQSLGDVLVSSLAVRDDHVLVYTGVDRGSGGWGVPEDPATAVWRLDIRDTSGSDASMITVSLDDVTGVADLILGAWVLPADPDGEWQPLGGTHYFGATGDELPPPGDDSYPLRGESIGRDPFSGSDVIHPMATGGGSRTVTHGIAGIEPGSYRLVIEAYPRSSHERYGCEIPIEVVRGEPLIVAISDLPEFEGEGDRWVSTGALRYPECPGR